MGFRTLAPQIQLALQDAVTALLPPGVRCDLGYPVGGLEEDHVYVGGAFDVRVVRQTSGGGQRGEELDINVRTICSRSTEDFLEVQSGALALAGDVEDAVSADPTLGGICDNAYVSAIEGSEALPDEATRQYLVVVTVTCEGSVVRG
jgi:hypothetical protein